MITASDPEAPGGVPANQPNPEVPGRDHPLPNPQEAPIPQQAPGGAPTEIPVEAPPAPGPVA